MATSIKFVLAVHADIAMHYTFASFPKFIANKSALLEPPLLGCVVVFPT
jgi:hypothetical protein